MPRRNRVTPSGEIVALPERGTMMGNRGVLHDSRGRIRRPWQVKRWILSLLKFRGRHREVMAPGRYTELFFFDEATGLAAGHRPCHECRRTRFLAFRDAWATGIACPLRAEEVRAAMIDERLHAERVGPARTKRTFTAILDELPDGIFVELPGADGAAHVVLGDELLAWTPGGYTGRSPRLGDELVTVFTPRSTVEAIRAGFRPEFHRSAIEASRTEPR